MKITGFISGKASIMSDDLTGAMDSGMQLLRYGENPFVVMEQKYINEISQYTDILVVDTESRNLYPWQACIKVNEVMRMLCENGLKLVYKKVDSTLRGNIGNEIEAVLQDSIHDMVVFCPAIPMNGRIIKNGYHYLNNRLITDSDLAQDLFSPVNHAYIPDIICEQSRIKTSVIKLEDVRRGENHMCRIIKENYLEGCKVAVADAVDSRDLEHISFAVKSSNLKLLPCGSAGLFASLCTDTGTAPEKKIEKSNDENKKPVLTVSGSPAEVSKKQIKAAREYGIDVVKFDFASINKQEVMQRIEKFLLQGKDIIVDGAGSGKEKIRSLYNGDKSRLYDDSKRIQSILFEILNNAIKKVKLSGVLIAGGDTAVNICRKLEAKAIKITGEVEPLIPSGKIIGGRADGIEVVTKAGGFGKEDTLIKGIKYLKGELLYGR